ILRTRLQTTTTSHTTRIRVTLLHVVLVHAWTRPEIVSAVQLDPRVNTTKMIKHLRAIDDQIANVRKLRHRFQLDRLIEIIDERRARLPRAAIDDHRTNTAYLFQTVHVPHRRRRALARFVHRVLLDLHQAGNDVEIRSIGNLELLPVLWRVGIGAAPDMNLNCLWWPRTGSGM